MPAEQNGNNGNASKPESKQKTGFRGPSPDVGKASQWKKGQSGNPGGRPTGIISAALRKSLLNAKGKELEEIVKAIVKSAKKGDSKAFAAIRDTVDGRPAQSVELSGPEGGAIVFGAMTDNDLMERASNLTEMVRNGSKSA